MKAKFVSMKVIFVVNVCIRTFNTGCVLATSLRGRIRSGKHILDRFWLLLSSMFIGGLERLLLPSAISHCTHTLAMLLTIKNLHIQKTESSEWSS